MQSYDPYERYRADPRMAWLVLADLDLRVTLTDWYHLAGDLEEFVYFAVDCVDM